MTISKRPRRRSAADVPRPLVPLLLPPATLISLLLLLLLLLPSICSFMVMAVDQSKFRTCSQTSFCRRHRLPHDDHSSSSKTNRFVGPRYRLDPESIVMVDPHHGHDGGDAAAGGEAGAGADSGSSWKFWSSRSGVKSHQHQHSKIDPYFRGPPAQITAVLNPVVLTPETDPIALSDEGYPNLELGLHFHANGVVRFRVTEPYTDRGAPDGKKIFEPRWTTDELVLTELVDSHSGGDGGGGGGELRKMEELTVMKKYAHAIKNFDAKKGNYIGFQYVPKDDETTAAGQRRHNNVVVLRLDPFELHLFASLDDGGGYNKKQPPLVSVNERQLFHFEHYRTKQTPEEMEQSKVERRQLQKEEEKEKSKKEKDRHEGKEVVGYWEDGLAIYSDGSREEKSEDADVEEGGGSGDAEEGGEETKHEDHPEQDMSGMWEEHFHAHRDSKPHGPSSVGLDITFPTSRHLYGLPEHASGLVLKTTRGKDREYDDPYRLYNLDVFEYDLDVPMALYGAIPVVVSHETDEPDRTVGVFYFNPTETFVDVTDSSSVSGGGRSTHWISESGVIDLFLLPGPDPASVHSQYSSLTGYPELPPIFALGYHQCRWNYRDERDVDQVHSKFEELDYPYDVLWLDIEHTDGKRYFTWDTNTFPTPVDMQKKLSDQGRRMVTIVDPHIKRDDNYRIHKEATKHGYYVKDADGNKDYDGWCWPGSSSYLDFTREEVRDWFASQFAYDKYLGSTPALYTWNDMNEPSVFNGPEVSMQKDLLNLDGIEHRQWHNVYGMLFHRATSEGLVKRNPGENERPFVLSRSFFAGSQKYGAIWTGDNAAQWSHLAIATPMLLSMGVGGLSFVGADVGGFFGDPDAELMTRWVQAGSYQPFFRGHAHHDTKRREPWVFGDEVMHRLRKATMARYALLPYFYTVFQEASTTGVPVMRPMYMQFPREVDMLDVDDQWLIGGDLLVKPVVEKGVTKMDVAFPSTDSWYDVDTMSVTSHASPNNRNKLVRISVDCPIDKIPVYQRGGSIIPRRLRLRRSSHTMRSDPYTLYVALDAGGNASGKLYMDDEHTFDYRTKGRYCLTEFVMDDGGRTLSGTANCPEGEGEAWATENASNHEVERVVVMGMGGGGGGPPPKSVEVMVPGKAQRILEFTYNPKMKILVIRKPELSALKNWKIKMI